MQWSHQNTSGTAQKIWKGWRGWGGLRGRGQLDRVVSLLQCQIDSLFPTILMPREMDGLLVGLELIIQTCE